MNTETSRLESPAQSSRTAAKPRLALRCLLVVASLIVAVSLIELPALLNIVDYREVLGNNFAWWPINNANDPELIHTRRPYVHFSGEVRGGRAKYGWVIPSSDLTLYRWDVKCDRYGFRNQTDLKNADTIVIGDSFVEGVTVPEAQLTTSLLAQLTGQTVANLGQGNWGPQQELVVLKRYGLSLRPHTVIWMFSEGSDLRDVIHYDHDMQHPADLWHAYVQRSFLHIELARLRTPPSPPGVRRAGLLQLSNDKRVTMYFMNPAKPLTDQELGAIDETARIIKEAYNLSTAQGARLIFVFAPEKFRVFHEFCRYPQESECRDWSVNDMPERMEKAVRAISPDIGYLDLTPSLVDAVKAGAVPYYPDDDHWAPDGHRVAAETINEYLGSSEAGVKDKVASQRQGSTQNNTHSQ
jgi:hypothetical protein